MTTPTRPLLPLISTGPHGSRSKMTCYYRCGNACDHPEPNTSGNETMRDLVEASIARRSLLKAGAVSAGAVVVGHSLAPAGAAAAEVSSKMPPIGPSNFRPVPPNNLDTVTVPTGFGHHVVISWGDRLFPNSPRFDAYSQTPRSASMQFGYNCDYLGVLPLSRTRALMVANHEYTN